MRTRSPCYICICPTLEPLYRSVYTTYTNPHRQPSMLPGLEQIKKGLVFQQSTYIHIFIHVKRIQCGSTAHSAKNLPADYISRHPCECPGKPCLICSFIEEESSASVRQLSTDDVLMGHAAMPYTNRSAWKCSQKECPDLKRVHAHLTQGTRPLRNQFVKQDVKRYLQCALLSRDGLLVTQSNSPFQYSQERIIIPKALIHGVVTATVQPSFT